MSDLTNVEKRKFEQLLDMRSGYVLDFSIRFLRSVENRIQKRSPLVGSSTDDFEDIPF